MYAANPKPGLIERPSQTPREQREMAALAMAVAGAQFLPHRPIDPPMSYQEFCRKLSDPTAGNRMFVQELLRLDRRDTDPDYVAKVLKVCGGAMAHNPSYDLLCVLRTFNPQLYNMLVERGDVPEAKIGALFVTVQGRTIYVTRTNASGLIPASMLAYAIGGEITSHTDKLKALVVAREDAAGYVQMVTEWDARPAIADIAQFPRKAWKYFARAGSRELLARALECGPWESDDRAEILAGMDVAERFGVLESLTTSEICAVVGACDTPALLLQAYSRAPLRGRVRAAVQAGAESVPALELVERWGGLGIELTHARLGVAGLINVLGEFCERETPLETGEAVQQVSDAIAERGGVTVVSAGAGRQRALPEIPGLAEWLAMAASETAFGV